MKLQLVILLVLLCGISAIPIINNSQENQSDESQEQQRETDPDLEIVKKETLTNVTKGHSIIVTGTATGPKFSVFLRTDCTVNDLEMPLHIRFLVDEREVVINTFFNGEWDFETRRKSPLRRGDDFTVGIWVWENYYYIEINNSWKAEHSHRVGYSDLVRVSVTGDVDVEKIESFEAKKEEEEEGEESSGEEGEKEPVDDGVVDE